MTTALPVPPPPGDLPDGRAVGAPRRAALTVGVVIVVMAIIGGVAWWRASAGPQLVDGRPADWSPILAIDAPLLAGPVPAASSAQDRVELAEVVALQAARTTEQDAIIAAWSDAEVVDRWDRELMRLVREDRINPVRASRAYALLNVAIHDAIVAAARAKDPERPEPSRRDDRIEVPDAAADGDASGMVAAAGAAERVLTFLFPAREARFSALADEAALSCLWAGTGTRSDVGAARAIGRQVGDQVVRRAVDDGSSGAWTGSIPTTPDSWRPIGPRSFPLEPLAGTWRPWLLSVGSELRPPPPPAVGSAEFERDAAELVQVRHDLTPDEVENARFWADGAGTVTPPGHWLLIGLDLTRGAGLGMAATARVMAYVSIAQADAFIACWDAKFTYWSARPVQLIDGFVSAIPTPPFPAYPSGHSTQSRAAATVLATIFPARRDELLALAAEAGESRILGGIHWRADHTAGAALGAAIGQRSVARLQADQPD